VAFRFLWSHALNSASVSGSLLLTCPQA
jgi:hypothetical protein